MKRKALLAITDCAPKTFETYSARGKLPFDIPEGRWSDYSIEDALELKLLMQAAEIADLDTASNLARNALHQLRPLDPFAFCGEAELFAALVRYDWNDKPEDWDARTVVAGRWQDIENAAHERIENIAAGVRIVGMLALPVKSVAIRLLDEARDFGLPESKVHSVPKDLTGFPEWFVAEETARRALQNSWNSPEDSE